MKIMYDVIVVGGGHAGIEAALAAARLSKKALLVTGNLEKVASLPCNPSIGGPAKGIVVREIDALGGQMGKSADKAQIQMKMLNASKGPAVRALRAQIDKLLYPRVMLEVMRETENLDLLEASVEGIIVENRSVKGIVLEDGQEIRSKTVILTTGTYLNSKILIGHNTTQEGPSGEPTTFGLSAQLKDLGFDVVRLKTGTPPRIAKDSIDTSKMTVQPGDETPHTFSFDNVYYHDNPQVPCYLTHTDTSTHAIINLNLDQSSMYGGIVEGVGPRYCPSIEDKVVRFKDKNRHQLFIEPESLELDELYVAGFSSSMPEHVQEQMIRTIPGLENVKIVRYAYAIEYDAIDPVQLNVSLETKLIDGLFCAGQINGTSGYEEASCQGLMAGINATRKLDGKEPFVLGRDEAYIGVLIDDLVTKGTREPYRLMTSRAEHRLLLRHDNADLRLRRHGHMIGLVDDATFEIYLGKEKRIREAIEAVHDTRIMPTALNNAYLASQGSSPIYEAVPVANLLKRPEFDKIQLGHLMPGITDEDVLDQVVIHVKYQGYIDKALREAERIGRLESKMIPESLDYKAVTNISSEAREKLSRVRPRTLGQASRISGVNPADISVLLVFLESRRVSG
jgi:tRNA uridine 5-carboxymethylaminomethyl modification enzyme